MKILVDRTYLERMKYELWVHPHEISLVRVTEMIDELLENKPDPISLSISQEDAQAIKQDLEDNPMKLVTFKEWLAGNPGPLPYLSSDVARAVILREYGNRQAILEILDMIIIVSDPSHEAVTTIPVIERAVSLNTSAVNLKAKLVGKE